MHLSKLEKGDIFEVITLEPVSRLDLIKYAGASGDYNPIHTIDEEATNAGLSGIIAHGMWTMGNLSKLFTPNYELGFITKYTIRFTGMVFLNDIITLKSIFVEKSEKNLYFEVLAVNQNDKKVVMGEVVYSLYE